MSIQSSAAAEHAERESKRALQKVLHLAESGEKGKEFYEGALFLYLELKKAGVFSE